MSAGPGARMHWLVEMARWAGSQGITSRQVNDALARESMTGRQTQSTTRETLQRCVEHGLLWRAERAGDVYRWFCSAELAQAWTALPPVGKAVNRRPMQRRLALPLLDVVPPQAAPAPAGPVVAVPVPSRGGARYVAGLALSRSELQAGRVTACPPDAPWGAGFSAAGIGRDPLTGAAWC